MRVGSAARQQQAPSSGQQPWRSIRRRLERALVLVQHGGADGDRDAEAAGRTASSPRTVHPRPVLGADAAARLGGGRDEREDDLEQLGLELAERARAASGAAADEEEPPPRKAAEEDAAAAAGARAACSSARCASAPS